MENPHDTKILIVDDSPYMRKILDNIIARQDDLEIVGEAADGENAVKKYFNLHPDIVIMNLVMPKEFGVEALVRILEDDPAAKVIMCSSLGQQSIIQPLLKKGAVDFIVKPFTEERVLESIRTALKEESP